MFRRGDSLTIGEKKWRFLQNAQQLGDRSCGRITYGGIAAGEDGQKYYVKYAGAFDENADSEYLNHVMHRWNMIDVQAGVPLRFASPFLAHTVAHGQARCRGTDINAAVLAYAEGISLTERTRQLLKLEKENPNEAYRLRFDLIRQLLYGIRDYSEGEDGLCVHRDLKPDNIRVQIWEDEKHIVRQQLRILDFDFLLGPEDMPERGGTAGYTHPDLYFGTGLEHTDPLRRFSWDLYSAGMIIYCIMEGRDHFSEEEFDESGDLFVLQPMRLERMRPAFGEWVRSMVSREQTRYHGIENVIAEFSDFLREFYGDYYAPRLRIPQYLEHIPGQEEGTGQRILLCRVRETDAEGKETAIPLCLPFTAYDGSLLRLTYGKKGNISGLYSPEGQEEIGALSYLSGDTQNPVLFIPYSDAAHVEEQEEKSVRIRYENRDNRGEVRSILELVISEL